MSADGPPCRERLVRTWSRRGPLRTLLGPLAWTYRFGVASRRAAFRVGVFRRRTASVPVVSIGNLTVGGTGKTPATLWLAGRLLADGHATTIVTRGYSGRLGSRTEVVGRVGEALLDIDEIGDEAALLSARFAGSVVSGADRVRAVELAVEKEGAEIVVLDDGFQHWRLARDVDIVLIDGSFGFGNGSLLPAGPLREPVRALRRAHAIVVTKDAPSEELLATLRRHVPETPVFSAELASAGIVDWTDGALRKRPLGELVGRRVVTVSGIAEPRSFYEALGALEIQAVEVLEYPDHHRFTTSDWHRINQAAHRADLVVCTEKDLVKLRRFPFARGRLVALRVDFTLPPTDEERLYALVLERLRLSEERVNGRAGEVG
ncbi:MAG: tetraacyldisaccharide 4'-kinase [Deltaproteobacteria bacterium]|nr:tetraacyldisaccharide 4'-kinase [Deltaproteobacteria bacterium]